MTTPFRKFAAAALLFAPLMVVAAAQPAGKTEISSLLGKPLYALADEKETLPPLQKELDADLADPARMHALGKALTRLWRFNEGIDWMSRALEKKPDNAVFLLDRGHAYVNIRKFKEAEKDLEKAAALAPDNRDVFYHLGLAHYLQRHFDKAADAFRQSRDLADADEAVVAASDWLYMSLMRAGKKEAAGVVLERILPTMQIKENTAYFHRLLLYKGVKKEEELIAPDAVPLQVATFSYGIGNWHLYNGRPEKAREYFQRIVGTNYWPAFGFVGAEVELSGK